MKCHYEILNVPRSADETEIKTAYKKLALKWHPDKNLENIEDAKEQFQLVQQAYEILSDRQERAWYDNHREQILRSSDKNYEEKILDVYQFFSGSCFKGFGDDEHGFYSVYRKVFEQIAAEDLEYMEDKDEFCSVPTFGYSYSSYEEVVGVFYSYWSSYSTKKSYVWLDPYDIKDARHRRVLKLIDKENKKVRVKAKKERNEEVRALVAFVCKRDRRVTTFKKQLEAKNLENRQKQEEIRKQKRLERTKVLHDSGSQAEWTKFDNVKGELEEIEKNLSQQFENETDFQEELNDLYCIACNKIFKTPKAFENHESSKKHKLNVQKIKEAMIEDDSLDVASSDEGCSSNELENQKSSLSDEELSDACEKLTKETVKSNRKKKKKKKTAITLENVNETTTVPAINPETDESDDDFSFQNKQKKKSKKNSKKAAKQLKGETKIQDVSKETVVTEDSITNHACATCEAYFSSNNKLFAHLKKTGHGVPLAESHANAKKVAKRK